MVDGVTIGDELLGRHGEVVADLSETHEDAFEHGLGADEGAGDRVAVGLDPLDVVSEGGKRGGDVAGREARVGLLDELLVRGGHLETPLGVATAVAYREGVRS